MRSTGRRVNDVQWAIGDGEAGFSEDCMTANAFGRAAMSRRNIIAGLIVLVLVPIPTFGKEPRAQASLDEISSAKAFLDEIYRHYLGSSTSDAKGIALTSAKAVRAYFTVGLASLIIDDRTPETEHGEPPVLDGDPFVGHREWDISSLAIEVKRISAFKAAGTITFTNDGKPEKIVVELQRFGNDWRIADIEWDSGSLRSAFRRRAAYDGEALPR
jgi:Protein of unknown function (DUF3828)